MKQQRNIARLLLMLPALLLVSLFFAESGKAMGMGGGGPVIVDDLVIPPGPMKSPMRIAPSRSGKFMVTDYQGGVVYEIDGAAPDQPRALFKVDGHPLAVAFEQVDFNQRALLSSFSWRDQLIIRQFVLSEHPQSLQDLARRYRLSIQNIRQIIERFLLSLRGARESGDLLFVGNDSVGAVEVYRRDGKKLRTFPDDGRIQPADIAYDREQQMVFVADSLNKEVKVYSRDGNPIRAFGSGLPLSDPKGIAVDPKTRQVFVSDYGDPRVGVPASIGVFDYTGRLIRSITGNFSRPQGITMDTRNLYVVDAMLGQVLVFDRASYVNTGIIGSFGVDDGQLLLPMDLLWDSITGKLWVTNTRLGKVTMFSTPGL